mmetsp:Transcript_879/g.1218  ORF Transcript_879/g.1218 Transcript_879/m.1218 type:complete len:299 (-) Transcript_879:74-970(-)
MKQQKLKPITIKPKNRDLLKIPSIAWPTVYLFIVSASVRLITLYLDVTFGLSTWLVLVLNVLATYTIFTPMHECVHNSLANPSGKFRWMNGLIGRLSATAFAGPFLAFKVVHLSHHKYTNEETMDPDFWSEGGTSFIGRFVRWMSQDLYYYYWYLVYGRRGRSFREQIEVYLTMLVIYTIAFIGIKHGFDRIVYLHLLLPARGAMPILALLFDWLPHHRWPHMITRAINPFKATHKLKKLFGFELTVPTLEQSMHHIHHLWPTVPWYRYHIVHKELWPQLKASGTEVWGIHGENDEKW